MNKILVRAHQLYDEIPKNGKPKIGEFSVLAAVYCELNDCGYVVSMSTGTKCIGNSIRSMDYNGCYVNDSHAEVLARRGLKRYFLKLIISALKDPEICQQSDFPIEIDHDFSFSFKLKEKCSFYLYVSESPCGDASIFDFTSENCVKISTFTGAKMCTNVSSGRLNWVKEIDQKLGCLRMKSGRSDITPENRSFSKSCTDKICKWNIIGLQGALISNFIKKPIRLSNLTVGSSNGHANNQLLALHRGLIGRFDSETQEEYSECFDRGKLCIATLDDKCALPSGIGKTEHKICVDQLESISKIGMPISTDGESANSTTARKAQSSSTSINWVRNVETVDSGGVVGDHIERRCKRGRTSISGGTVEVSQYKNRK